MHFRLSMLCLGLSVSCATAAVAQDIQYTLINSSSAVLVEFYTGPVTAPEWGEDLLGADVLVPGESAMVTIADGQTECAYDLLFIFADNTELSDTVDICELASYELFD
ncbi:hypothetical protein [Roseicyclus mahoneyensis]|jgi:hypothetical protein|uniref:Uncharacterized protein n=1 Tax=Roseicyclus mahoneyensis TaxID=164332 RepID=A0A316H247_9RHOB|nr:hypothetical protein [Roseicyclus mahoneyensis]PWK61431.1 hypothetical protein C7455_102119 [Roseicyclus mahoneyensis]